MTDLGALCTRTRVLALLGTLLFVQVLRTYMSFNDASPRLQVNSDNLAYDPAQQVAWAIPTGGRTRRSESISAQLSVLTKGGARPENIYIFEDNMSRDNQQGDDYVAEAARGYGVNVVWSNIPKTPENAVTFGLHLAQHYRFMLDYVFVGNEEDRFFKFVVILEDDLVLAPDIVKFFHEMSRVMRVDPSLYCVCGHVDNAWYATSPDPKHRGAVLRPDDFDFRRAEHFMAPGWMTSSEIYTNIVRPVWLDDNGQYKFFEKFKLKNGHWDRFWDSQIQKRECLFPEVPRVSHQGGDGFTVGKQTQLDLYSNLRLSDLDPAVSYGDLNRLTADGWEKHMRLFLAESHLVSCLEEIAAFRDHKLRVVIAAENDRDEVWSDVMTRYFGMIGLGGYGGHPGYAKQRAVHKGTVFVRWMTNLVLVIAKYSPYYSLAPVDKTQAQDNKNSPYLHYAGCYVDKYSPRTLPHLIPYYTKDTVSPMKCAQSCRFSGFEYAGVQNGEECWCGRSLEGVERTELAQCEAQCSDAWFSAKYQCGGPFRNSVYFLSVTPPPDKASARVQAKPIAPPPLHTDCTYEKGDPGESCTDACARLKGKCEEQLFPLLHRNCDELKRLMGCTTCVDAHMDEIGFVSPAKNPNNQCLLSMGKFLRCESVPPSDYQRACVCKR